MASGDLENYALAARMWMLTHGLLMAKPGTGVPGKPLALDHAPFSLYPSKFPRPQFDKAYAIQEDINVLVDKISNDVDFLNSTLKSAAEADEFTRNLLDILNTVTKEGVAQPIQLGLHRSDYMLDSPDGETTSVESAKIKQVEINTISVSFASLGTYVCNMHRYMSERYGGGIALTSLPQNEAISGLAGGLAEAWQLYAKKSAVVMMVVLPDEHNSFDQCWLEYCLWEEHKIKLIRRSLADLAERGAVGPTSKALTIDGHEVAVAYYRSGYAPHHYPTQQHWDARLLVERSLAIKCPSVSVHLAGAKKVQQVLADRSVLARFMPADKIDAVMDVFTGLYPVEIGGKAVTDALARPQKYVLKPQREGGGNNLYNDDLHRALTNLTELDQKQFILMDRIVPPPVPGYIVRDHKTMSTHMVSELGIFGVCISKNGQVLASRAVGHLLRSKPSTVDDGGVAAGVAVLDSPCLVD
eukprot:comp22238_c0_seq1/m.32801 comp22238_c0_seq1/g.32801  ORF comp22238_c0_seq1/g.32801 comp22238_c0_seq1/m.32801 type:complete len:470 (-) comp22238_c0_seq1:524-1933(-)